MPANPQPKKVAQNSEKKRGRKKLELSVDAQKKIQEIEERLNREKQQIITAEKSRALGTKLQDSIERLKTIMDSQGKVRLINQAGREFFLDGFTARLVLRDEDGKRFRVDLDQVSSR